jgi:hypothetical protein
VAGGVLYQHRRRNVARRSICPAVFVTSVVYVTDGSCGIALNSTDPLIKPSQTRKSSSNGPCPPRPRSPAPCCGMPGRVGCLREGGQVDLDREGRGGLDDPGIYVAVPVSPACGVEQVGIDDRNVGWGQFHSPVKRDCRRSPGYVGPSSPVRTRAMRSGYRSVSSWGGGSCARGDSSAARSGWSPQVRAWPR